MARHVHDQFVAFALQPALLGALWDAVSDGSGSAALTLRFADGSAIDTPDFGHPVARAAGAGSALRALSMRAALPGGATRQAMFEAGSSFVGNECRFEGDADFVARGEALLRQGLAGGVRKFPDTLAMLYVFTIVFCLSPLLTMRLGGTGHVPHWLTQAIVPALPLLILARVLLPPRIDLFRDDAAFAQAAARQRQGFWIAAGLGVLAPFVFA